jgi:hypothetical protein
VTDPSFLAAATIFAHCLAVAACGLGVAEGEAFREDATLEADAPAATRSATATASTTARRRKVTFLSKGLSFLGEGW